MKHNEMEEAIQELEEKLDKPPFRCITVDRTGVYIRDGAYTPEEAYRLGEYLVEMYREEDPNADMYTKEAQKKLEEFNNYIEEKSWNPSIYQCTICGDFLRSSYPGELVYCSCEHSFVDQNEEYIRCGGPLEQVGKEEGV